MEKIEQDYGVSLPSWLGLVLTIAATAAALVVLYKPLGELVVKHWQVAYRVVALRKSVSKRARRRALFADHLESAMRRLAEKEEWRDSRFAELEAEVEFERESKFGQLRRRLGGKRSARIRRVPSLTAALKKSHERLIVLEGDPGAGKSVALRHLAQGMASWASRRLSERTVLPIYVNLKSFRPQADRPVSAEDVREFVLESLNPAQSRDIDRFLQDEFDSGREEGLWLFLFDSFDETPAILSATEAGSIIDDYAGAIAGFIGIESSRGIIASREFRGPGRAAWPRFHVMPLTHRRRAKLIKRADLDDRAESALLNDLSTLESSVQQLADNPLFLSLLCEYVRDEKSMPESTHAVLESYVRSRLRRDQDRIERRFAVTTDSARAFAEEMAFQMLSSPELGLSASRGRIVEHVTRHLCYDLDEGMAAIDALIYSKLARFSDDDVARIPEEAAVAFSHRRLQEYFATCVVIKERSRIRHVDLLTNGRWRETAVAVLQTQRPEDSAELLAEAEVLLRARFTAPAGCDDEDNPVPRRRWPPGVLHILDLLANGLKPEQSSQHSVSGIADQILERAWGEGNRLDKKWVVELCAAAGTERAIDYLTRAFDSESLWLRDQAYAQVRRIGAAGNRLEPQIRQMLIDISVGGGLRRERKSVRAQLLRLSHPAPLQRAVQLILAAPVVAAVTTAFVVALVSFTSVVTPVQTQSTVPTVLATSLLTTLLFVLPVFLRRFSLVSDSRAQRYARNLLGRLGLGDGAGNKLRCSLLNNMLLFMTFCSLVIVEVLVMITDAGLTYAMVFGVVAWLACWSHTALLTALSGVWTERRYWLILPLYIVRRFIDRVRADPMIIIRGIVILLISFGGGGVIFLVTIFGLSLISNSAAEIGPIILMFLPSACIFLGFVGITLRRAWRRRKDSIVVSALVSPQENSNIVRDIQGVLEALQTDEGIQLFLCDLRKRELQRHAEVTEFLVFLSLCLERPGGESDSGNDDPAATHSRHDWVVWWAQYRRRDHDTPLRSPSSETIDELGRVLEDAQRTVAFHS